MSLFNDEQIAHMEYLGRIHPEKKCWCGWYPIGQCHSCPPNKTNADKQKVWCPECHNDPGPHGGTKITHCKGCKNESPT